MYSGSDDVHNICKHVYKIRREAMTIAELVSQYRQHQPKGHFFDRETLAFFGEKISKMTYNGIKVIKDASGHERQVHEIRSEENDSVLGRRWKLHFFDAFTFEDVIPDFDMVDAGEWVHVK